MSDRLPPLKPKQLIKALERAGWQVDRIRGSHHILVHPDEDLPIPVPVHNRGTLAGILRNARISRERLRDLL